MTDRDVIQCMSDKGWTPAQRLLQPAGAREFARIGQAHRSRLSYPDDWRGNRTTPDFEARPWFKSLHALVPEFFDLATHPEIIACVRTVLGENLLVWGAALITRRPDQIHRWHVDIEHTAWMGVSVFVALEGVRPFRSGLKFISGSHRLGYGPDAAYGNDDDTVLGQARRANESCTLDHPPICDGEFMMFSGRVWHGSNNVSGHERHAALIQYTTPSSRVAIPFTWDPPMRWSRHRPPCALASGQDDFHLNRLVSRPSAEHKSDGQL